MVCLMETASANGSGNEEAPRSSSVGSVATRHSPMSATAATTASPSPSLLRHRNSVSPSVPRKIMSKNYNNTLFPTSYPSNLAELQLYRVMQNASLLYYYDTLLEMGGDDVQQLCDAGEEEFLEIMSLVGMASKPLHVRRLQKSLQEWVTNPTKFKIPLIPGEDFELELPSSKMSNNHGIYIIENNDISRPIYSPSSGEVCALPPVPSPGLCLSKRPYSPLDGPSCPPSSSSSPSSSSAALQLTPTLLDSQIAKLAGAAERLSKQLPQYEPKPYNTKKKMSKELELVMSMPESDPRRMDEIRRYAAIYGRFDCKRRPEKPLTLHEVSVNEAAAQICRFVPALLTRRDELFPLARQVVKDSGCYYSKTQVPSMYMQRLNYEREVAETSPVNLKNSRIFSSEPEGSSSKRPKLETDSEDDQGLSRQEKGVDEVLISRSPLHSMLQLQSKLHSSARDLVMRNSTTAMDYDETESHLSYSNSSSPYQINQEQDNLYSGETNSSQKTSETQSDSGSEDIHKFSPKVIAASGDNIIAVANPALALSPTIFANDSRDSRETHKLDS